MAEVAVSPTPKHERRRSLLDRVTWNHRRSSSLSTPSPLAPGPAKAQAPTPPPPQGVASPRSPPPPPPVAAAGTPAPIAGLPQPVAAPTPSAAGSRATSVHLPDNVSVGSSARSGPRTGSGSKGKKLLRKKKGVHWAGDPGEPASPPPVFLDKEKRPSRWRTMLGGNSHKHEDQVIDGVVHHAPKLKPPKPSRSSLKQAKAEAKAEAKAAAAEEKEKAKAKGKGKDSGKENGKDAAANGNGNGKPKDGRASPTPSNHSWKHHESYFPEYERIAPVPKTNYYEFGPGPLIYNVPGAEAARLAAAAKVGQDISVHYPVLPRFEDYVKAGGKDWRKTQWGDEGWTGFGYAGEKLPNPAGETFGAPMPEAVKIDYPVPAGEQGGKKKKKKNNKKKGGAGGGGGADDGGDDDDDDDDDK